MIDAIREAAEAHPTSPAVDRPNPRTVGEEGRDMAIGRGQLNGLGFQNPQVHGETIAELERLRESDTVRVIDALAEGVTTPDIGGLGSTATVGDWICARLEESPVPAR